MNGMMIFANKCVTSFEEALPFIEAGKKVIYVFYDDEEWRYVGKEITMENYDNEVVSNYEKRCGVCYIMCDAVVFENGDKVTLPKGKYVIQEIWEMVN